jgi:hypothetical protein
MIGRGLTCRLTLGLALALFTSPGDVRSEGAAPAKPSDRLDEQLVQVAIKLYDLNVQVPVLYQKAFAKDQPEAGEGLYAGLFNDPIAVLQLAVRHNQKNMVAHFYLGKSYYSKSYEGEGSWTRSLLLNAEQHFSVVTSEASKQKIPRDVLAESHSALEEIRKILQGMGSVR